MQRSLFTDPFFDLVFDLYFDFRLILIVPWQDKRDFRRITILNWLSLRPPNVVSLILNRRSRQFFILHSSFFIFSAAASGNACKSVWNLFASKGKVKKIRVKDSVCICAIREFFWPSFCGRRLTGRIMARLIHEGVRVSVRGESLPSHLPSPLKPR